MDHLLQIIKNEFGLGAFERLKLRIHCPAIYEYNDETNLRINTTIRILLWIRFYESNEKPYLEEVIFRNGTKTQRFLDIPIEYYKTKLSHVFDMKRQCQPTTDQPNKKPKAYPPRIKLSRTRLTANSLSWVEEFKLPVSHMFDETEFEALWQLRPTEANYISLFGREIATPRRFQAYGIPYRFSGKLHKALPIPEMLQPLIKYANSFDYFKTWPEDQQSFNGVLVNWYQDGNDYIGFHADDEKDLNKSPNGTSVVFSISFGATRLFHLKPKNKSMDYEMKCTLENGSVVVMGGLCQSTHKHSIPKCPPNEVVGRRINITLRNFKK